jgi:hypothetical protein
VSYLVGLWVAVGIKGYLNNPLPIPQINKDYSPMIPPTLHPTHEGYLLPQVFSY